MRIGTWNLLGRWGPLHADLLVQQDCDVWLLTEVPDRLDVVHHVVHAGSAAMGARKAWAAILSRRSTQPLTDPSATSVAAAVAGLTFVCTALSAPPAEMGDVRADDAGAGDAATLRLLSARLPRANLIWGGALGQPHPHGQLASAVDGLGLQVPTVRLPHRRSALLAFDQIAVPASATVLSAHCIEAVAEGRRLSDHDAYVVEIVTAESAPPTG